ncbi:hypothetical protein ACIRBX_25925 [Kitasatospora sp. NPDC096147]|uniref:hypothetical protein n=1 Tax=Kitasatospora sp. NPDC096147 TaxID=3364093 RepID=UPI0037FB5A8C
MKPGTTRALLVLALLAAPALLPSPATAADPPPRLSLTLDDGRDRARPGDELTWTVTVRNLGHTRLTDLRITQQLPAGAAPAPSLSTDGTPTVTVDHGTATWDGLTLEPDATRQLRVSATLGDDPSSPTRAATTACAHTAGSTVPLACASDLDLLPVAGTTTPSPLPTAVPIAAGALGLAALALLHRRRSRRAAAAPTP